MIREGGELVVYRSEDGRTRVQLRAVEGTVWLTQAQIAELYDTSVSNIAHIMRRVLGDGEVTPATIDSESKVQQEGSRTVRREVKIYNLDMVLAVGYRVTSPHAVHFRQWATTVLREYLVKGFVLDDRRLKDPRGGDYFDELLDRIRDIRASEKRFYQKVRDVFAASSVDYDGTADAARTFFATIQNKLCFAVTGHTAAELVVKRCDPTARTLGLTTWDGGRVRKKDVDVAKNYLTEDRARRRQEVRMADWVTQTDRFLVFNEREVLDRPGRVSAVSAKEITAERYAEFDQRRRDEEAERAALEEWDDLRKLIAIERGRPEEDEP